MDNTNKQPQEDLKVNKNIDNGVSIAEAQRKTAIFVELFYSVLFLLVGFILIVWSLVIFYHPLGDPGNFASSYFAMGIVGVALVMWGVASLAIGMDMQVKNKTQHKITNNKGVLNWFTLNPYSWSLVRQSNGYLSKKQKAKLAALQNEANSDDSLDEKADKTEEQQVEVTRLP